jgi:hypothetical protein
MPQEAGAQYRPVEITFWSRGAQTRTSDLLQQPSAWPLDQLAFEAAGRFYAGTFAVPAAGALVLALASPRPVRIWIDGNLALDESLFWRSFQRELRAAVIVPAAPGIVRFLVEVGPRPSHPPIVDERCPSRNRAKVLSLQRTFVLAIAA